MTPTAIATGVFVVSWIIVAIVVFFRGGSRKRTPVPDPPAPRPIASTVCPRIQAPIRESELPTIPKYLVEPFVFQDANLGIAMLAGHPVHAKQLTENLAGYTASSVERWIFRVHGDHWCTVRRATANDIDAVDHVKRYSRTLLISREQ